MSAQAHTRKFDDHLHASATSGRHASHRVAVAKGEHFAFRGRRAHSVEFASSRGRHESGSERVTYVFHRHGRPYLHTVWHLRDHRHAADAVSLYRDGIYRGGWMECVPYARQVSGVDLTGDAYLWWGEAAGRYERGQIPEPGSVLSFRNNRRMRLGHVAVVTEVVNQREVLVTQANWAGPGFRHGDISSDIAVIDVSPDNDWTAVRVALGHTETYGSVYPTHGFIYARGDAPATLMAEAADPAPQILTGRAPSDLRSLAERAAEKPLFRQTIQFASAPSLDGPAIASSAPDRALR